MNIVIEATAALSGGRVYLTQLLPRLAALAPEDRFVVYHTEDLDVARLGVAAENVAFHRVRLPASNARNWLAVSLLKVLWRLFVFPFHWRRHRAEVVFSNTGFGPLWRPRGARLALALHNSMPFQPALHGEENSLPRRLRIRGLRRLLAATTRPRDRAIVFSRELQRLVREALPELQTVAIHHGIDWGAAERNAPVAEFARLGVPGPFLLFVSQLHRYKNVLALLDAFAKLRPRHPGLSLLIVGKPADPAYRAEIERRIAALHLEDAVVMRYGCPREELPPLYRAATACVYPSLAENCPFGLLEALAFGLPIAASNASAMPEIAADAARYFDPHNPDAIAHALDEILSDETLRNELRERAIRRAKDFSWDRAAQLTLDAIRKY
ncbi:MAG: glycosyltransferase family 1 protein [Blastocatellia bacterium]|nr:glycosyltransferase family 1 protein [Blastocatellia bacterium]